MFSIFFKSATMLSMQEYITLKAFLIVCPLIFIGGFVDSIGGGGGLITLPAYVFAGLPLHLAIGTNKLSSAFGTLTTTLRFIKNKLVNFYLAIPTVIAALLGSYIGAHLSLLIDEGILKKLLIPVLGVAALIVINKKVFGKEYPDQEKIGIKTFIVATIAAFIIGGYDGFYGPGTGTFLIIVLNVFAKLNLRQSNAQAKVINLTTNLTSLAVFLTSGHVVWLLGIAAAVCGILGNYFGSALAIKKSEKITRPIILLVIVLLFIKIVFL